MLARIIRFQLHCVITPKTITIMTLPFIANTFLAHSTYGDLMPIENIKAVTFIFYLPINIKFDVFRLIMILLPLLLIIGTFITSELKERSIYLLLHMKSFRLWFQSFIVVSFFTVFLFFMLGYVITYVFVLFFQGNIINDALNPLHFLYTTNEWTLLTHQFFLLVLSVFLLVLLNILFAFIIKNIAMASLLTIIFLVASITIGNSLPSLLNFLPLNYGLFAFREFNNFSFAWTYTILLLTIFVVYILNFVIFMIRKETLFRIQ